MYVSTDLHGHTLFSDGRATPEAYVDFRRGMGMRVVAVSDHDVFAGVRRAAAAAALAGMILVPAAEITASLHFGTPAAEQFHVLAYFPPGAFLAPGRLERTCLYQRGLRVQYKWREFVLEWLATLAPDDRDALDPEGRLAALPAPEFPALQAMIDRVVRERRPLFERFRDTHVRFWDDRALFGWTPEECIDEIRADGALDVVAHPARYRDKARTRAVLEHASGLEVYTSRHKAEVAEEFRRFAEERRKLWTASADDHQNARYARPPCGTPLATLERMLRRPLPMSMILAA
jgi:predicted metal-dependent phosphoesterase TrpH